MDSLSVNAPSSIVEAVIHIAQLMIGKEMMAMASTSLAIAAFTFGALDLFMKAGLNVKFPREKLAKHESAAFGTSILLLLIMIMPIILAIAPMFSNGGRRPSLMGSAGNILIALAISLGGGLIFSLILRATLPKEKITSKLFLMGEAFETITDVLAKHLANWIGRAIIGVIDLGIKVLHKPFVMQYAIMALVLNLAISFILVAIMGVSNSAGQANLAGSIIGGIAHALIRRPAINKLRDQYKQEEVQ